MKTLNNSTPIYFLLAFVAVVTSCGTTNSLSEKNVSDVYRTGNEIVQAQFNIHHDADTTSTLHFQIDTEKLIYAKQTNSDTYTGRVKLKYEIYPSFESRVLIDSNSVVIQDVIENDQRELLYGNFPIPISFGKRYVVKLITTDLYREKSSISYLAVDKSSKYVRQNYLAIDAKTGVPLFRSWFFEKEKILIQYHHSSSENLSVSYYNHEFDIAPPPFAVYNHKLFDYKTNDVFQISEDENDTYLFEASRRGFYHIQADSSDREGFTLFQYHDGFPTINSTEEMVSALRFITSKKEFKELTESDKQKLELDQFWLKIANNPARARELIKAYYNRVQNANIFFSCHKEGWKTDRGIIYIVFGPPDIVYKSSSAESWVYGEENNYLSVTFNFLKVDNPFTRNDFTLKRAPIYKNQWYRAVDSWRQGRVTSLDY